MGFPHTPTANSQQPVSVRRLVGPLHERLRLWISGHTKHTKPQPRLERVPTSRGFLEAVEGAAFAS
jgi:hypothetical protein